MRKKKVVRTSNKKELNWRGIAFVIAVLAGVYILYTNMLALIIATFGTVIIIVIVVVVGAYYILPLIGIEGLAGLIALFGLSRKR